MIKKIFAALDDSPASRLAWLQALDLSKRLGARPIPIHVLARKSTGDPAKQRREAIRELRERIGLENPPRVAYGDPVKTILRLAEDLKPDLLVMGTHGRTGLERFVLGSVTESVIRLSPVPVLAVRRNNGPIKSILAPVIATHYSMSGLAEAATLARQLGAKLTLLHIRRGREDGADPNTLLDEIIRRLDGDVGFRCDKNILRFNGDPARAIVGQARKHGLVAMVYHRKRWVDDLLFGTTLQRVLKRSPVPVLSIPYLEPGAPARRKLIEEAFRRKRIPG